MIVFPVLFALPLCGRWPFVLNVSGWVGFFAREPVGLAGDWVLPPRLHLNTNASLFYAAAVMQSVRCGSRRA